MKREYLKPEAEYISLYSEEIITDDMNVHFYASSGEGEGRLESTVWGEGEGDSNWKP